MMEEQDYKNKLNQEIEKIEWEAPRLICLDKGKTEGNTLPASAEGGTYYNVNS